MSRGGFCCFSRDFSNGHFAAHDPENRDRFSGSCAKTRVPQRPFARPRGRGAVGNSASCTCSRRVGVLKSKRTKAERSPRSVPDPRWLALSGLRLGALPKVEAQEGSFFDERRSLADHPTRARARARRARQSLMPNAAGRNAGGTFPFASGRGDVGPDLFGFALDILDAALDHVADGDDAIELAALFHR